MKNIANDARQALLDKTPMSIDTEDHELYRLLVELEISLFRARISFMVRGERSAHFRELIQTSGDLYVKIQTNLGGDPPSTGSRRCRVRDILPGRLLSGDPRACRKLGSNRTRRAPAGSGVGNHD